MFPLIQGYGAGLTITNRLTSSGEGGAKSGESGCAQDELKMFLDEKLAREQERKQQVCVCVCVCM